MRFTRLFYRGAKLQPPMSPSEKLWKAPTLSLLRFTELRTLPCVLLQAPAQCASPLPSSLNRRQVRPCPPQPKASGMAQHILPSPNEQFVPICRVRLSPGAKVQPVWKWSPHATFPCPSQLTHSGPSSGERWHEFRSLPLK